jgi:energy-coupling factor transporter ATP-binding protein EcfA2
MTSLSILFQNTADRDPIERPSTPACFVDLALDQIVAAITAGKDEYNLAPFFSMPLHDIDGISFRHEIMRDLENIHLFDSITTFAKGMRAVRENLAQAEKISSRRQKERWFLDAVEIYCNAVTQLIQDLSSAECTSRGFLAFREYVTGYAASERFNQLLIQTRKLKADLSSIRYCLHINGLLVQVSRYDGAPDYSAEIEATFEGFKQGSAKGYTFNFSEWPEMNQVESNILDLVVQLYPDIFSALENYCMIYKNFQDPTIVMFDREVQFYMAYLSHIILFKKAGLHFCYPRITETSKEVYNYQGFDLALAAKLLREGVTPICNDFHLRDQERVIVVTGPNQGGKTTFARTFGQMHYLACLGCLVPGTESQLFLFDRLFSHFEKEENSVNLRGKLQDDLVRIHAIMECATPKSIIIINEIFASTTFRDASVLSRNIAAKIIELDLLCVWVTFIDELASLSENTVSMVSTVVAENPAQRTYKIVRRPADGLAYALSIAEKYRLTYAMIKERIPG